MADDLAQKSFLKAFQERKTLRDIKAAKAWLFQIAYRTFVDDIRKESRRRGLADGHSLDGILNGETPAAPDGLKMDISRAMDSLPAECRAVVILCMAHGMSHTEAARATGLPLGTVKSHALRGRDKLRAFLSAYETVK